MENSVQSWHRRLFFCHHLISLFARASTSRRNRQADLGSEVADSRNRKASPDGWIPCPPVGKLSVL